MSDRLWFGPAGAEYLGDDDEGTPVLGDEDGAGAMTELTAYLASDGDAP